MNLLSGMKIPSARDFKIDETKFNASLNADANVTDDVRILIKQFI